MDDYDYMDNYFKGTLSPEEMKRLDQKIQEDPAFAEDVAFYCSTLQEIKNQVEEEKKERFRNLYKAPRLFGANKPSVIFMRSWMKPAVAAAVIILVAAAWLWWPQETPQSLADKYIRENLYSLPYTMGQADSLQTGIKLNNDNKLSAALVIFEQLSISDSTNDLILENAGIVSLHLKQYDKALIYFTRLDKMEYLNSNPGKFYKALTLLERNLPGDTEIAKQLLKEIVDNKADWKDDANTILKKL